MNIYDFNFFLFKYWEAKALYTMSNQTSQLCCCLKNFMTHLSRSINCINNDKKKKKKTLSARPNLIINMFFLTECSIVKNSNPLYYLQLLNINCT